MSTRTALPVPDHYDPAAVSGVWRVPYEERARQALAWAQDHEITPAARDRVRVALLLVDMQNTFCTPGFELFVAGPSGSGAVDDSRRLVPFLYRHLHRITHVVATMDSHQAAQIFHAQFLVDENGRHPDAMTFVTAEDVERGRWRFNDALAPGLGLDADLVGRHLRHYTAALARGGKYALTVWPYHAMLGGIGHALVSSVEEAVFFHSVARSAPLELQLKGRHPLTEHYSVLGPEVAADPDGRPIGQRNDALVERLLGFDAVVVAGQAKSHCVAWTMDDLLRADLWRDRRSAGRFYLLQDCTSPVVVPGAADFTKQADAAFERFAAAGAHLVHASEPPESWPDWPG